MKLPTILVNKNKIKQRSRGFLIGEIMIAFSLMTIFLMSALILSTTSVKLRDVSVQHLEHLKETISGIATATPSYAGPYGNNTLERYIDPFTLVTSDFDTAWGRDSCNPRIAFDPAKVALYSQGVNLGIGNVSTDIEVRNDIAYLTADGTNAALPDMYVINLHDPTFPFIMSSLNTGPGLAALEVAGPYIYAANRGTTNQLQVVDIHNRFAPFIASKLKLPLPTASTTPPLASAIFYSKGLIYLGTEKWDGSEFSIIDVASPVNPHYLAGFEAGTLINDIYVRNGIAYLSASDIGQMKVVDVHNPSAPFLIGEFSPSGWAVQQGKVLSYFEGNLSLGRTVGGFNVVTNHEFFLFSTSSPFIAALSHDIPGGVYGILLRPPVIYLATRSSQHEFQVANADFSHTLFDMSLTFQPQRMTCDLSNLYFATGTSRGVAVVKLNSP